MTAVSDETDLKRNEVISFDDGLLTIKISGHGAGDGWGSIAFHERQIEIDADGFHIAEIPPSELRALRDFLNRIIPAALSAAPVEPELISGVQMDAIETAAIAGKPLTSLPSPSGGEEQFAREHAMLDKAGVPRSLRHSPPMPSAPVAQEPVAALRAANTANYLRILARESASAFDKNELKRSAELIDAVTVFPPATSAGVGADEIARVFVRWKKSKNLHESLAAQSIEKELLSLLTHPDRTEDKGERS